MAWVAAQYRVFVSAADATSVTLTFANQTQRADCTYRKSTGDLIAFSAAGTEGIHQSAGEATFVSRR